MSFIKFLFAFVIAASAAWTCFAQAVVPGWLTDPTAMKEALGKDESYQPPEQFKYPYLSTYYVKPTVTTDEEVKVGIFVTDFESSKIRFLDDSHRFTAFLEYRLKDGVSKVLKLADLPSGDAEFNLGKLVAGNYELRVWAIDQKGRESHRVIHDFRVMSPAAREIPADKVYAMTEDDLAAYGIRNDGDLERVVHVSSNAVKVVKEKRANVPGYTVTIQLDPKTGELPYRAFGKASVIYDADYDKSLVESNAVATAQGLQKLIDEKAAAGYRKVVLLPGTYRISHEKPIDLPDAFTLDLGRSTLKLNQFTGEKCTMVRLASVSDAHLVGGTLEGDYWAHDYKGSEKDSEWVNGFLVSGDSWYCSVEDVTIREIVGYGGSNCIAKDNRGSLAFFCERLPKFAPGGLDAKTGEVDESDSYRFTTDFKSLRSITEKAGRRRLQISKYLGYQGVRTRSWQVTVAWYDADKKFLSSEIAWQFREMLIPEKAAYIRVSVEDKSLESVNPAVYTEELQLVAFRYPINCAIRNCRFERCRCVGYAAAQMKNWLFEGNFFTESGEAEAKCAFDAEDGADQMQDVYFLRNVFRKNPVNNSILTCSGHNFILEKNDGGIHFWGRTHSPCVRDNDIEQATFYCDSRLRSGYARFEENRCTKGIRLGVNDMKERPDNWDFVFSGKTFDGSRDDYKFEVGSAGRVVGCTFKNMPSLCIANAFACTMENCKGWFMKTRWLEVTMKDSLFKNFIGSNRLDRCHFVNSRLQGVGRSTLFLEGCDFTDCAVSGFGGSNVELKQCRFTGSVFEGGWWDHPVRMHFKNCAIATSEKSVFLNLGVYTIGDIHFEGCRISGKQALAHVRDLRPLQFFQGESPDRQLGRMSFKDVDWQSESKMVLTHGSGRNEALSSKSVSIDGSETDWPGGVTVATNLFPTWTLKK